jgi:CRISPR-associated protein Csx17
VLRLGRDDRSPNSLEIVARRLEQAAFQVASRGERQDVCMMLEALGAAEQALSRSTRSAETNGIRPLFNAPSLPWAEAADDGTPEFAVAVAIGSLHDRTPRTPTLRDYLHGTEDGGRAYDEDRRHAIDGNSVVAVLAGIHARRHLDVARSGGDAQVRLDFEEGSWCDLDSARMLAIEALDEKRIMRLIRGLALLSHRTVPRLARRNHQHPAAAPAFDLLAFAWMGQRAAFRRARPQMEGGVAWDRLRPRPGWAARLAAGATESVLHDAVLSLRMAGVQPMLTVDDVLAGSRPHERLKVGQRLAAALLVQVAPGDIRALRHRLAVGEEETPSANDQMEKTA